MKMKILAGLTFLSFLLLGVLGVHAGDPYGVGAITDFFSNLWISFWPLVALLFIIELVLRVFGAPSFIGSIFSAVNNRRR